MSILDGVAADANQGSTCLLNALPPPTVCVCPVAQMNTWIPGMKKINACCIKSVMQARPWWRWTLATTRPRVAVPARRATTGTQTASAAVGTRSAHRASELNIPCSSTWTRCAHPASWASSQISFRQQTNANPGPTAPSLERWKHTKGRRNQMWSAALP